MATNEIQGNLFRDATDEDRIKEFLKMVFEVCERIYSSRTIYEAYTEWETAKEIQEEMEREALREDDF